jgi:hypothetical protein
VRPRITALALQALNPPEVLAAAWNPTTGQAGAYRIIDPAASVAGASAAPTPSVTVRATTTPPVSAAAPAARRTGSTLSISPSYVIALAVLISAFHLRSDPAAGLVLILGFLAASALGGYVAISILRSGRP